LAILVVSSGSLIFFLVLRGGLLKGLGRTPVRLYDLSPYMSGVLVS